MHHECDEQVDNDDGDDVDEKYIYDIFPRNCTSPLDSSIRVLFPPHFSSALLVATITDFVKI